MQPFVTEYRVIYGDCDPFDVVYYGRYLDFFERGRTELCRSIGLPYRRLADQGIYTPVTEEGCRYVRSARYDDLLEIATVIARLKRASITFEYAIHRKQPRALLAEGFTVHAFVNKDRKVLRVPSDVIAAVKGLME